MPQFESKLFDRGECVDVKNKPLVPDEVSYKLQLDTLDDFVFKFSGLVCSLEHQELKRCFESIAPSENVASSERNDSTPSLPRNTCIPEAKSYGDCLYRRHYFASSVASRSKRCRSYFHLYDKCVKTYSYLFSESAANRDSADRTNSPTFNPAKFINMQKECEDWFYENYLYCLKFSLKVHSGTFDSIN